MTRGGPNVDEHCFPMFWMRCENLECDRAFRWDAWHLHELNCLECGKPQRVSRFFEQRDEKGGIDFAPPEGLEEDTMNLGSLVLADKLLRAVLERDEIKADQERYESIMDIVYVLLEEAAGR